MLQAKDIGRVIGTKEIEKQDSSICCLQETYFRGKIHGLKLRRRKRKCKQKRHWDSNIITFKEASKTNL